MSEKISRKNLLKHDEFVEAAFDFERWLEANWKPVAAGVAAVVVLSLGVWGAVAMSRAKAARASRALSTGLSKLMPPPGAESLPSAEATVRYAEALPLFEKSAADGGSSAAGRTATFYRGAALVQTGRPADAIPILEPLAASSESDMVADLARAMLAEALAVSGQTDRAIAAWKDLAGRTGSLYPRDLARYWEADTLYRAGRTAEAKTILDELTAQPPGIATEDAKRLLARVGGASAKPVN